jgi:hypothetical protein
MSMDFSNALRALKVGHQVRRVSWAEGRFIAVVEEAKTICEWQAVPIDAEVDVVWISTPGDLLAEDWELV